MGTEKYSVVSNLFWRFAERCGAQGVSFVVSIVLARILLPEDYGTVAILTVFTTILNVFVDSGLGNALIQKKDADDLDFSSVFYFNIVWCFMLYGMLFLSAPYIAGFYNNTELIQMVRVAGLTIVISGVKNVQQAYISRTMQFKKFFFATLGGTLGSAIIGIMLAYKGYGAWALIIQNLFNSTVDTIILWITVNWRPRFLFSLSRLKELFSFGWKLLASALLDTVYNNIRPLIIGKMYSSSDLAYYNKGQSWPVLVVQNINSSIDSVLLPVMSAEQDQASRVKVMTRRAIKTSSYIMWPMMIGLMAVSVPLVRLVLTEKWLPSVPYMCIFCFVYAFWPIHTANLNAVKAMGRSDLFLKLEIQKKVLGMAALLISMPFGVLAMTIASAITTPISAFINASPNKKLLNYSYKEQLADMLPSFLLSVLMGGCVWLIGFLQLADLVILVLQVAVGIIIYYIGSKIWHFESFEYLYGIGKDLVHRGKRE